jgi:fibronectin-binding autotransporter adhesin
MLATSLGATSTPAADYLVSDETSLRDTIAAIIAGTDPNPVIILQNDIVISPTAFPPLDRPMTIDTNGHSLSGIDTVAGPTPGATITFDPMAADASLTIDGEVRGGNAAPNGGNVLGGTGLNTSGATVTVTAGSTLAGGQGGGSLTGGVAGDGATGLVLTNGTLLNNGLIVGGDGGVSVGAVSNSNHGVGGNGAILTGGNDHVNNGIIRGGAATGFDHGQPGLRLTDGTLTNNGTIAGGGSAADPGLNGDAVYLTNGTIINNSTGLIHGADAADPAGGGGNGITVFGADASTVINYGTIRGGSSATYPDGEVAILGGVGGTGDLTIINAGTISGSGLSDFAIRFNNMRGILELRAGSVINGNVVANAGIADDILRLGGADDESFDVSDIGPAAKYRNFNIFEKTGASTWIITGQGTNEAAPWDIYEGTLLMSAGSDLGDGAVDIFGGTLAGVGIVGATTNHGGAIAPGINGIGTLTIDGDYTSNGGMLMIEAVLGNDASAADLLLINGSSLLGLAPTLVSVTNLGGLGNTTVDGIKIVDVAGATSDAGTFSLVGPAIGGAYVYDLFQNDIATGTDGDWYLRNTEILAPTTPTFETYPVALLGMIGLPTLRQRVGDRADAAEGIWTRIEGAAGHYEASDSSTGASYDSSLFLAQIGLEGVLLDGTDGSLTVGLTAQYGRHYAEVFSAYGDGSNFTESLGLGGTLTWRGTDGTYVDAQAQIASFSSDLDAIGYALIEDNAGTGLAVSLEVGRKLVLDDVWAVTPQAQLRYASVDFDDFTDAFGSEISLDRGDSLVGRIGVAVDYQTDWQDDEGRAASSKLYGIANLTYEFLDGTTVVVSGTDLDYSGQKFAGELGLGGTLEWADGTQSVHGELLGSSSFEGSYAVKGTIGFAGRF